MEQDAVGLYEYEKQIYTLSAGIEQFYSISFNRNDALVVEDSTFTAIEKAVRKWGGGGKNLNQTLKVSLSMEHLISTYNIQTYIQTQKYTIVRHVSFILYYIRPFEKFHTSIPAMLVFLHGSTRCNLCDQILCFTYIIMLCSSCFIYPNT